MSSPVEVKITGLDQIQKALEEMSAKKAPAAVRSGLRDGAKIIQTAIVQEAPKDTGLLAGHIDVKTRVRGKALTGSAFIGPNAKTVYQEPASMGKKGRSKPAWLIAKWLEMGTAKMAANPFMTRAFEANKSKAVDAVIARLKEIVSR